jgi:hypothetical protein
VWAGQGRLGILLAETNAWQFGCAKVNKMALGFTRVNTMASKRKMMFLHVCSCTVSPRLWVLRLKARFSLTSYISHPRP